MLHLLQVQRRHVNKPIISPNNTPSRPPTEDPSFSVTPLRSTGLEAPGLPTSTAAKEVVLSALAGQQASLVSRLEMATAGFEETSAKVAKMTEVLARVPTVEASTPSDQFRVSSSTSGVQDPITRAENVETLVEPVAPSEGTDKEIDNICIVGEIVTAAQLF